MKQTKTAYDRQRFAGILSRQWAENTCKSEPYQMAYEYIQAIATLEYYSRVYGEPNEPVARILAKYGLLEN